jgi:uncharacterized protein (DUF302 family)
MRHLIRISAIVLLATSTVGCSSLMRSAMVEERSSPHNMEETIKIISERAKLKGWSISEPKKLDQTIQKHGGPVVLPVSLLELCEPHHAGKLLANDNDRWVSVMMPCTISVYEKSDGKVYVANLKAKNMGGLMGGNVAEIMGGAVADAQEEFLTFLQKH